MKNTINNLFDTNKDKIFIQKTFDLYITRLRQSFYINEDDYRKLLEKKIVYDIFTLSNSSPHELGKYLDTKEIKFI